MGQPTEQLGADGKPCGVCDGFKHFSSDQKKKEKNKKPVQAIESSNAKLPCPPDSRQLGRHTWTFLHTMAAYYPDNPSKEEQQNASTFMTSFAKLYPCSYCANHLQQELTKTPPRVSSSKEFSQCPCPFADGKAPFAALTGTGQCEVLQ
ncbi:UNVERIFIED_CONTAM: hypothetical protein HDU68_010185 [Siphonaria sp. JEL0065]|nr:hypothetical protein HDU68_010185 [Siphonaria sp. JEL0065]